MATSRAPYFSARSMAKSTACDAVSVPSVPTATVLSIFILPCRVCQSRVPAAMLPAATERESLPDAHCVASPGFDRCGGGPRVGRGQGVHGLGGLGGARGDRVHGAGRRTG